MYETEMAKQEQCEWREKKKGNYVKYSTEKRYLTYNELPKQHLYNISLYKIF